MNEYEWMKIWEKQTTHKIVNKSRFLVKQKKYINFLYNI